jgi:para-nitrobenzyl esterase
MSNEKDTIVKTKAGKVEGAYKDGLYMFKKVPYAAPPVGELRWLPPQPVKSWDGVRPAKEFGPIAPQNPMAGGIIIQEPQPQDEDCLFLNIWTKGLDDARRPVMVWIHGGAFIIGSGTEAMYTGGKLASYGDVVLVTINYRLGALGFMNLDVVTGGRIPASGNEGLLDQIAAIEWVRDNIAAFGGDPDNITVFGESAGGMSIGTLMSMPAAKDKFPKAILESGAANTVSDLDEAVAMSNEYLKVLGLTGNDVEALRVLTTKQLLDAQQQLTIIMQEKEHRVTPFQPLVDGRVIPGRPIEAIRKGSAKNVVAIIGTNLEEWKLFAMMEPGFKDMDEAAMLGRLSGMLPDESLTGLVEGYRKARTARGDAASPADILTAIQTDIMFRMPAINLVEAQRDNGQAVYNYLFTWKSPVMGGVMGACHTLEIGFVYGQHDDTFCGTGPDADRLSRCMQDAWLAFARTGDPSCETAGKWPVYGKERLTMILDKDCHVEAAPYEGERSAWDRINMLFTKPI